MYLHYSVTAYSFIFGFQAQTDANVNKKLALRGETLYSVIDACAECGQL